MRSSGTPSSPGRERWWTPSASPSTRRAAATPGRSSSCCLRRLGVLSGATLADERHDLVAVVDAPHLLASQPGDELRGGQRTAEEVALGLVATELPEELERLGALHALGDRVQPKASAQIDQGSDDHGVVLV